MSKKNCNSDVQGNTAGTVAANVEVQRQAALLKTEALQSAIFNSANFSSIATDAKGVIQIFNVGAERMLGYAAADVMNKITPADISDPQEVIARAKALSAELSTPITPGFEALVFKASRGIEDIYELTYVRKDGSRFPAIVSVTALRDAQNTIIGYLLIGTDNTARKRAEEALLKAGEERNRFFALSRDMLCTAGFDGYFKDLNPAWEKTLGYTKAELLAKPYIEFIHPDDRAATLAEAEKVSGSSVVITFENRYRCKDGSYRWFLWSATPVLEDQLVYAAARDVTERKRAEEALREGEERFRTLANNISQLAWMADEQGSIFWYNQRWFDYSGTTLEDMEGWGWQKVHHPDHVQRVVDKIRHCFQTGEVWEDTFPLRGRDGNYRWFLSRAVPIHNEQGKVFRWFGTNTDVTEQREAEEELKKNREQLEAANKELEAFSYSVSHDLRAPLRHIDGFATLLQKHAAALDEKGRRHLATISESAKQMGALIDDLLAFSHVGRSEMHRTAVNLEQLVKEAISGFRPDTEVRKIAWTIGTLPEVHGDPSMLRQVLVNLIGNAVKYTGMREEARIEIGSRNGVDDQHDETVFFVRDNGAGFDMQYVNKLFGVFQRLHSAGEFEGTGIGLANVRRIIQRHGGRTWAEGKVAEGATFYFSLPHVQKEGTNG